MERAIDNLLENTLSGVSPLVNLVAGIIFIIVGIAVLIAAKKQPSKGKTIAAWVCIGIGVLGLISAIQQLIF